MLNWYLECAFTLFPAARSGVLLRLGLPQMALWEVEQIRANVLLVDFSLWKVAG